MCRNCLLACVYVHDAATGNGRGGGGHRNGEGRGGGIPLFIGYVQVPGSLLPESRHVVSPELPSTIRLRTREIVVYSLPASRPDDLLMYLKV